MCARLSRTTWLVKLLGFLSVLMLCFPSLIFGQSTPQKNIGDQPPEDSVAVNESFLDALFNPSKFNDLTKNLGRYSDEVKAASPLFRPGPQTKEYMVQTWYDVPIGSQVSFGSGIQAVSFSFKDGTATYVKSFSPLVMTLIYWQNSQVTWTFTPASTPVWTRNIHKFGLAGALSFDVSSRATATNTVNVGFGAIPLEFMLDDFLVGIGIQFVNNSNTLLDSGNFNVVIPISYKFNL